ncbi:hypothetical protein MVEN_00053200 [Mycena venus]|uniref:Uncharacterized protein n=1 Tax=Mycena venus TaxID=2733690 RepID=A0A8H7DG71_9AGAR|nr:hypothetical protein MVEN_00053200 [Mycena venus]
MAEMIVADCKVKAQNRLYNNPPLDIPCKCLSCTTDPPPQPRDDWNCSGCIPETIAPLPKRSPPSKPGAAIPKRKRLTRLQKEHVTRRLQEFQIEIWRQTDITLRSFLPPEVFLPTHLIKHILDIYITLDSLEALNEVVKDYKYLTTHQHQLLDFLLKLKPEFKRVADDRKAELAAAKAFKKRAAPRSEREDSSGASDEEGSDSNGEEVDPPPAAGTEHSAPRF